MSELCEARWAVVSERGCEANGLKHTDALELMRRLVQEKVHGLCIVTADAARRLAQATSNKSQPAASTRAPRKA
jgi:hypothetical protein